MIGFVMHHAIGIGATLTATARRIEIHLDDLLCTLVGVR